MYWQIAQILFLTFFPFVPVNPSVSRPTETRQFWVFECTDFTNVWTLGKRVLSPGAPLECLEKTD
jgi:hypothetical protein